MIHLVVSICILIITIILIKFSEKFNTPLESPKILKIQKKGTSAIIEWYNTNKNVTNFVLLYVDVDKLSLVAQFIASSISSSDTFLLLIAFNVSGFSV